MVPDAGVRELKIRASEIIRDVRERRARYVITYRGRPVGVLLPLDEATQVEAVTGGERGANVWEELSRLGEEIGQGWQSSFWFLHLWMKPWRSRSLNMWISNGLDKTQKCGII
jgi:prevent-host-death family protein